MIPKHFFDPEEPGVLRILSDSEWRGLGITQSLGWEHYEVHGEYHWPAKMAERPEHERDSSRGKLTWPFDLRSTGAAHPFVQERKGLPREGEYHARH